DRTFGGNPASLADPPLRLGDAAGELAAGGPAGSRLAATQMAVDGARNLLDRQHAVDGLEQALPGVMAGERRSLGAVRLEPALEHLGIVVGTDFLAARGHFRGTGGD